MRSTPVTNRAGHIRHAAPVPPPTAGSLGHLLAGFTEVPRHLADQTVTGLSIDSRQIKAGHLFFALNGGQQHGLEFLDTVQAAGAHLVLWEPPYDNLPPTHDTTIPLLAVPELRQKTGLIAGRFYGEPAQKLKIVGITGTDGKTSCAHFIAQALSNTHAQSKACGILGTLGIGVYGQTQTASHTTPDPLTVQRFLAEQVANDQQYAVMEVSSHALDQGRVNGVQFAVAVLTNLARDHLDYHKTIVAYAAAKRRLFLDHQPACAVLNFDDPFGRHIATELKRTTALIAYGLGEMPEQPESFVRGKNLTLTPDGCQLQIQSSWGEGELRTGLLGRFNANNILATLATLLALDVPFDQALAQITQTVAVPGRMERLGGQSGQALAVIDYAHTPHALQAVLQALREHLKGRLWCVFGCGGDRDPGKRPLMAAVAEQYADQLIMTDDNPRSEAPAQIISDMLSGLHQPKKATVIHDRRSAILEALAGATADDIVLIAGKGHEDYQLIGDQSLPFSDHAVAHEFLYPTLQNGCLAHG
ncbi:MAG: UDP-N-acetylmuramoyl-L-alanyl-D-glutamate--2,6-diaminopimelate ligase [Candidatus Contendobacter odensis]|uniref:UDP-N-acetylmuramoyl-L-alanyl-D-glutamate--2,6-diaminopimelate ligase n=1 Tax=Candidatus Contendibacter odensensis TaxID=1400860 RepID=A0A2G6PFX5_9GAMM|nr:MAG: UDP-N-acetylmuramoyl-L-alanyl-D-glutamate--2,6-diaminopimelate ligase [Candidatus Contendobacter odensis]